MLEKSTTRKPRAVVDGDRGAGRVARNRLRIAWMYYVEGLTQNEIADKLGIGRVTVVRNINEALKQREVKIWIEGDPQEPTLAIRRGGDGDKRSRQQGSIADYAQLSVLQTNEESAVGSVLGRVAVAGQRRGEFARLGLGQALVVREDHERVVLPRVPSQQHGICFPSGERSTPGSHRFASGSEAISVGTLQLSTLSPPIRNSNGRRRA